jgi:hypothetical protein
MDWDQFWGPPYPFGPDKPATDEEIRQWEERHALRLPPTLAKALTIQNGGCLQGTELMIFPLPEFTTLEGADWDRLFKDEGRGDDDRSKLIRIGAEDDSQAAVILDYNAGEEPGILLFHHDPGDELREAASSFDEFLRISGEEKRQG